jgi:hypothetical protein
MNLFDQPDDAKIARLKAAGWFSVHLWGQPAWRSPDGRRSTMYTDTALQWMEEENAAPIPPGEREGGPTSPSQQPAEGAAPAAQADRDVGGAAGAT